MGRIIELDPRYQLFDSGLFQIPPKMVKYNYTMLLWVLEGSPLQIVCCLLVHLLEEPYLYTDIMS